MIVLLKIYHICVKADLNCNTLYIVSVIVDDLWLVKSELVLYHDAVEIDDCTHLCCSYNVRGINYIISLLLAFLIERLIHC